LKKINFKNTVSEFKKSLEILKNKFASFYSAEGSDLDKDIFIIFIFIKEVSKKAYRSHLIALYIVISSINLPNIGRRNQDQYLN